MSHYAKVLNGIVTQVITAEIDFFTNGHFVDTTPGTWIQTSYNTHGGIHYNPTTGQPDGGIALRGNFAGLGYIYDSVNDVFYAPRPFDKNGVLCASWTISSPNWLWIPPIPQPEGGGYYWDEPTKTWLASAIHYES